MKCVPHKAKRRYEKRFVLFRTIFSKYGCGVRLVDGRLGSLQPLIRPYYWLPVPTPRITYSLDCHIDVLLERKILQQKRETNASMQSGYGTRPKIGPLLLAKYCRKQYTRHPPDTPDVPRHVIRVCSLRRTRPQLEIIPTLNKSGPFATIPLLHAVGSVSRILTTPLCGS